MTQSSALKIVIIDDEPAAIAVIKGLVEMFCSDVLIAGTATSAVAGVQAIEQHKPDVVLLDIDMPGGNGFNLLEAFQQRTFKVIFITASSEFAIKALRFKADDYLLKPVNPLELKQAFEKIRQEQNRHSTIPQKIALPEKNGYYYANIIDIIHIEGDGSYATIYLKNGMKKMVSKNIKSFDEQLSPHGFIRCHQSHLINLAEVNQLKRAEGIFLVMSNGNEVAVSRAKKEMVLQLLHG
jgi:two-component system, LytTR family, response regulator